MNLYTYWLKLNRYYSRTATHKIKGIVVHSTGCNQPKIEPFTNVWNSAASAICVHAIVGTGSQGFGCYQLIPWDKYVGGCGKGRNGSYNSSHIQFEICEDGLTDPAYFNKVYREAVELCAYLCKLYRLSPSTIVCHSEACALGYASNHADVMHWFPRHGKTMDDFREDVEDEMKTDAEILAAVERAIAARDKATVESDAVKSKLAEAKALGISDCSGLYKPMPRWQGILVNLAVYKKMKGD